MFLRLALFPLLFFAAGFQAPENSIEKHYRAAQGFHNAGKVKEAEAEYRAALGEAYYQLGRVLLAAGEYQNAVKSLDRAATNGSVSETALIDLAAAYFHTQQYEKAVEPLGQTLVANPRSLAARHLLGKVFFMLRQFDKAAVELESAFKQAPDDLDISYTLALARLKQGQVAAARRIFRLMVQKLGSRPEVHNLIGRAYRETKHYDEAIAEFKKAIALDPKYPRTHYNLGLSYLLKDGTLMLKEAAAEFRTELKINPEEFLPIYNLGLVCVVERQYEEAARLLEKAVALRPQNPDARLFLGNAYHGLREYEKAIESLRKAFELNPNLDKNSQYAEEAHFILGQSLVRAGRVEEGEKELEIARELKAKALATDRERIVAYLNTEEYRGHGTGKEDEILSATIIPDAKRQKLKESEAFYAGVVAKIHNQAGRLYAEHQNLRAAIEHFRAATEWNTKLPGVNYNLGLAYYKSEMFKEAIPPLELEIRNDP
ncbi:MAG TPA: tetratricopeptide repeat protein, partial [Blastocatellia bacterium]|nr:tetratricopeptide repeat protein [Blastocatellia bacterium]